MNPIKEFFKRKAAERKFKTAGPAHKLNESASSKGSSQPSHNVQSSHSHKVSREAERAGAAALERIQQQQQQSNLNWLVF